MIFYGEKMLKYREKTARLRVEKILDKFGARLDENGNLQIDRNRFEWVIPYKKHGFLQRFSSLVRIGFSRTGLGNDGIGRMIHQFRIYIDENNIRFVRTHYKLPGDTDLDALKRYEQAFKIRLMPEKARLHNKSRKKDQTYQKDIKGHENIKRLTPDFHSEFIIDEHGHFVTRWDVYERDKNGDVIFDLDYYKAKYGDRFDDMAAKIVNTESFNYALRNDKIHKKLDIWPSSIKDDHVRMDESIRSKLLNLYTVPSVKEFDYSSDKNR